MGSLHEGTLSQIPMNKKLEKKLDEYHYRILLLGFVNNNNTYRDVDVSVKAENIGDGLDRLGAFLDEKGCKYSVIELSGIKIL